MVSHLMDLHLSSLVPLLFSSTILYISLFLPLSGGFERFENDVAAYIIYPIYCCKTQLKFCSLFA